MVHLISSIYQFPYCVCIFYQDSKVVLVKYYTTQAPKTAVDLSIDLYLLTKLLVMVCYLLSSCVCDRVIWLSIADVFLLGFSAAAHNCTVKDTSYSEKCCCTYECFGHLAFNGTSAAATLSTTGHLLPAAPLRYS